VLDVNLRGVWLGLKHVLPHMRRRKLGAVVNTASVAGMRGFGGLAAYCASKAAVISLTQVAAIENARLGIRVNALCPGMVATPLALPGGEGETPPAGPYPSGRMGSPVNVAAAAVWLCSDAAAYVNGTSLPVDGGWMAAAAPRSARVAGDRHEPGSTNPIKETDT
jgi:NAD(P)-dependent dehydrogenase (short-subunit alcohol dehydrogenase family)